MSSYQNFVSENFDKAYSQTGTPQKAMKKVASMWRSATGKSKTRKSARKSARRSPRVRRCSMNRVSACRKLGKVCSYGASGKRQACHMSFGDY